MKEATLGNISEVIEINPAIKDALAARAPIVALESTIITHGMPYPQNVETALEVEKTVRNEGAIPCTMAVVSGKIKVGLTSSELEELGKLSSDGTALKLSRRDLPYALAMKRSGGTTVAATIICAQLVGIPIFATGGIGGVHREGEKTMDVSADLQELSRNNVTVVCAGAKSILDLGLTLEVLETLSVPVVGYRTDYFPSFYSRKSPFPLDCRVDEVSDIASLMKYKNLLGCSGGVLIANPIPAQDELPSEMIEGYLREALMEASRKNITGKKVTPFLLSELVARTEGRCVTANISLIKNNAKVAAQLAVTYSNLMG